MRKLIFTFILSACFSSVSAQLKVNSDGNVGIGTIDPQYKLDITGTLQTEKLLISKPNNIDNWNNLWQSGFYNAENATNTPESSNWFWGLNMSYEYNNPNFRVGGQMAIKHSPNNPILYFRSTDANGEGIWAKVLNDTGNQYITGGLSIERTNDEGGYIDIRNEKKTQPGIANSWKIYNMTGDYGNSLQFWAYNSIDCIASSSGLCHSRLTLMDSGQIGIGKIPDSNAKLDVAGSIYAYNVLLTSDERLKTKIKPLSEEKDKLYLLQGKSYKKTLPPTGLEKFSYSKEKVIEATEYGYLAQELKEIYPDLVSQDSAGYYSVNYIGLIPVIIEALKDQRLEIEKQREQIKQLVKLSGIKIIDEKVFVENGIEDIPLLMQNTPNPFNQTTEIAYYIPQSVKTATLHIYDLNGFQQKQISITERGKSSSIIQAATLKSGIYFYTLICDGMPVDSKQMILTK